MTNDTQNAAADNTEQTQFTYAEVKINELREDIAKLYEKLAKREAQLVELLNEAENASRIEALKNGDLVTFGYGRAATRRIQSGVVHAISKNEAGKVLLKVCSGEGFDATFSVVDASNLLFTPEQVAAEEARIAQAVAEAQAAAAAAEAAKAAAEGGAS